MAFHSTSDRYAYIFGNTAERLQEERETEVQGRRIVSSGRAVKRRTAVRPKRQAEPKKTDPATEAAIRRNKAALREFDWKFSLVTAAAVLFCALAAVSYVRGTVTNQQLQTSMIALKAEKAELESKRDALETEIDKGVNLDEIRTYAEETLNMVYPKQGQIIYYQEQADDYFRQYESVDLEE